MLTVLTISVSDEQTDVQTVGYIVTGLRHVINKKETTKNADE